MSEWTEYHGVTAPTPGGSDGEWAPMLLAMFNHLFAETSRDGTLADRPASAPAGALYRATDRNGTVYRYADGSWSVFDGADSGTIKTGSELQTALNASSAVDLDGATVPVSTELTIPDDTTLKNGTLDVQPGDYPNSAVIYRSGGTGITTENITIEGNGVDVHGIFIVSDKDTRHTAPTIRNVGKWGIVFESKGNTSEEGAGPLIESPRVKHCNGGVLVLPGRDYVTIDGGEVYGGEIGLSLGGENTTVLGTTVAGASNRGVSLNANKIKLYGATINHNFTGIATESTVTDIQRLDIDGGQMLVQNAHAIDLSNLSNSTIQNVQIGRPGNTETGDGVILRDSTRNTVKDIDCDIYNAGNTGARYCVNEVSGSTGNVIRENVGRQGAGFSLNSATHVSGNVEL